jgi:hypothetical protein
MSKSSFFAFSSLLHLSSGAGQKCIKCGYDALCGLVLLDFLEIPNVAGCPESRRLRSQMAITQFVTALNGGNLANVGNTP